MALLTQQYHSSAAVNRFITDEIQVNKSISQYSPNSAADAYAVFTSNMKQDIIEDVLNKLEVHKNDINSKSFVVMCQFVDQVTSNMNDIVTDKIDKILQQQQSQQLIIDKQNKQMGNILKSIKNIENDNNIFKNKQQQQYKNLLNKIKSINNNSKINEMMNKFDIITNGQQIINKNQCKNIDMIGVIGDHQIEMENRINIMTNNLEKMKTTLLNNIKINQKVTEEKLNKINDSFNNVINNHETNLLSTSIAIQGIKNELKELKHELEINNNKYKSFAIDCDPLNINKMLAINKTNVNKNVINNHQSIGIDNNQIISKNNQLQQLENTISNIQSKLLTFVGGIQSSIQNIESSKLIDFKPIIITQKIMMKNINKIHNNIGKMYNTKCSDIERNDKNLQNINQNIIKTGIESHKNVSESMGLILNCLEKLYNMVNSLKCIEND